VTRKKPKTPAAELRRLARLRELAAAHRRTERALVRAIHAALARGIGVRRVAAAIGWPTMNVWRLSKPGADQPGLDRADVKLPPARTPNGRASSPAKPSAPANRVSKPKASGK
jgi:hypothetical protein